MTCQIWDNLLRPKNVVFSIQGVFTVEDRVESVGSMEGWGEGHVKQAVYRDCGVRQALNVGVQQITKTRRYSNTLTEVSAQNIAGRLTIILEVLLLWRIANVFEIS